MSPEDVLKIAAQVGAFPVALFWILYTYSRKVKDLNEKGFGVDYVEGLMDRLHVRIRSGDWRTVDAQPQGSAQPQSMLISLDRDIYAGVAGVLGGPANHESILVFQRRQELKDAIGRYSDGRVYQVALALTSLFGIWWAWFFRDQQPPFVPAVVASVAAFVVNIRMDLGVSKIEANVKALQRLVQS